jgi:type III pantothenate kinase
MILLVDIGNTRIKYASLRGGVPGAARARVHRGAATALRAALRSIKEVTAIVAVNVAGAAFDRALATEARARGVPLTIVTSTRAAGGVRNGYTDTWRLGADRWVGAIGAHALARGKAVVFANAGTALTLDAVTANGRHLGGAIVPGPAVMIESLLFGTHGIRRRARGVPASARALFASNTASALAAGAAFAAAALIDRAVAEATRRIGGRPLLLLTGGSANAVATHIKSRARIVPDLVLRGLAVLASPSPARVRPRR